MCPVGLPQDKNLADTGLGYSYLSCNSVKNLVIIQQHQVIEATLTRSAVQIIIFDSPESTK